MTKLNTMFVRAAAVLALALGCSAGQALAAPIYHVAIDTTSLSGQAGYLDFLYLALDNADPAQATLTHFAGDFDVDTASFTFGGASGAAGSTVTLASGNGGSEFGLRLPGLFRGRRRLRPVGLPAQEKRVDLGLA
jgi:hypothetical protein